MKVELIDSLEDWRCLKDEWNEVLSNSANASIFLTYEYLSTAWQVFHRQSSQLFIVIVRNDAGHMVGCAPFRLTMRKRGPFRLRRLEFVTTWEIDKPGIIADSGQRRHCLRAIFAFLEREAGNWDVIELSETPCGFGDASLIQTLFSESSRFHVMQAAGPSGPCVDLTETWESFLTRHRNLRKKLKRLVRLIGEYRIDVYRNFSEIDEGIAAYLAVEKESYKYGRIGLQKDDLHLQFYRSVLRRLARSGNVAIRILRAGEERVAADISYTFGDTVYFHHATYDKKFARISPGTLFTGLVLREYFDKGFRTGDFLCGFASYLQPWASTTAETWNIQIRHLSARMRVLRLATRVRSALQGFPERVSLTTDR